MAAEEHGAHSCRVCFNLIQTSQEINRLAIDVEITTINKQFKVPSHIRKQRRDSLIKQIIKNVSALRNSGGGCLFIHFQHQQSLTGIPRCLYYFHEFADVHLQNLLNSEESFTEVFHLKWVTQGQDFTDEGNSRVLQLFAKGGQTVCTAFINTRVCDDQSILEPKVQQIAKLLREEIVYQRYREESESQPSEESRSVQFKVCRFGKNWTTDQRVSHIWDTLRLKEYVTNFTKLPRGGTIYFGIIEKEELTRIEPRFHIQRAVFEGIGNGIPDFDELVSGLKEKIQNLLHVQDFNGTAGEIDCEYSYENNILTIKVPHVSACVFFGGGPETFEVDEEGTVKRLSQSEWLDLVKKIKF